MVVVVRELCSEVELNERHPGVLVSFACAELFARNAIEAYPFVRAWSEDAVLYVVPGLSFVFGTQFAHGL